MNVLIVSATDGETAPFRQYLQAADITDHEITMLVTGVGAIATAHALTRELYRNKYDFVLQAGVGGSFDPLIQLGEVVFITSERYGDLGAEDNSNYLDIFDMGLMDADLHPHTGGALDVPAHPMHNHILLQQVTGLTVNTVSGYEPTIAMRKARWRAQVESMEGAAFHYVCLQERVTFAQVRGISNYVIPRDKSQWKMRDAIINLNNWLIDFMKVL